MVNVENGSSASTVSEADEVQSLHSKILEANFFNKDIVQEEMLNDDMAMTNVISRAITKQEPNDEEMIRLRTRPLTKNMSLTDFPTGERRPTLTETIKSTQAFQQIQNFGWWDTEFKRERLKVYITFVRNYLLLSMILIVVLSFMWGAYYRREYRYVDMKMLVVIEDQSINGITPIIGNSVNITAHQPQIAQIGGWEIQDLETFTRMAASHNNTVEQEIVELVHHQNYWAAIHVRPNVTFQLYEAILNNETTFNMNETLVQFIYETGRDPFTMSSYTIHFLESFERAFDQILRFQYPLLVSEVPKESQLNALAILSQPTIFLYNDMRPAQVILMAPLQLGLTYLIVFSFFSMVMTIKIQMYLATIVSGFRFLLWKFFWAQVAYLVISLAYTLLNIAFGVTYQAAFGHSGALVMWAVAYLTIASIATLNEIVTTLCFLYFPPMIGGWFVFLIVVNIAPTTSPMVLTNNFYRYGYAMPIHNSYELTKVVFCNTYKGQMGRNFGILIAWFLLSNCILPLVLIHVSKKRARDQTEAEEAKLLEEEKTSFITS
jgi:hypothetical protein